MEERTEPAPEVLCEDKHPLPDSVAAGILTPAPAAYPPNTALPRSSHLSLEERDADVGKPDLQTLWIGEMPTWNTYSPSPRKPTTYVNMKLRWRPRCKARSFSLLNKLGLLRPSWRNGRRWMSLNTFRSSTGQLRNLARSCLKRTVQTRASPEDRGVSNGDYSQISAPKRRCGSLLFPRALRALNFWGLKSAARERAACRLRRKGCRSTSTSGTLSQPIQLNSTTAGFSQDSSGDFSAPKVGTAGVPTARSPARRFSRCLWEVGEKAGTSIGTLSTTTPSWLDLDQRDHLHCYRGAPTLSVNSLDGI